jgi:HK97 family phage portal protein
MALLARAATKAFDQGIGTLAAGSHIGQLISAGRSVTGISVTTDKAFHYSAFWAAVRILSEDIAKLPLTIHRRRRDGSSEQAPDHPLDRVIRYQANPQMTAFIWREVGMAHAVTWGNHYAAKAYDGRDNVVELWPLDTSRMEVERRADSKLHYTYTRQNGQKEELTEAEVFHVPGLSWDGIKGYSLIHYARETIGLGLATEEHGARFFGNGATTNFVLSTDSKLTDLAAKHLADQVKDTKTGLSNAWKPWVLEEGLKPFPLSMPNDDAQWLETRKHQVTDVSRWTRIPAHKLSDLEHATFTNIEHQAQEYVTDALMGWIVRWESEIGRQLLRTDWIGAGGDYYAKFNVNALLRGDQQTRYQSYAIGRQWGFINGDKIAELEDWNRWPGGDEYIVPLNMTTLGPDGSITQTTMTPLRPSGNGVKPDAVPIER